MSIQARFLAMCLLTTIPLAASAGRCLAAPSTAQDLADRYNSASAARGAKISPEVANTLIKAQKEDSGALLDAALADAQKARDAAQTNYEKLKVNQTLTQIYMDMKDIHNAAIAAETAADLQGIPIEELPDVVTNACILATAVHDYDKAANYARAMQDLKLTDDRSKQVIDTALGNATQLPNKDSR